MSTATALIPLIGRAPSPAGFPATRIWLSLDLEGLAGMLAGRHRLPVGAPHFAGPGRATQTPASTGEPLPMPPPRLARVPEEAFVSVRRPDAPAAAALAKTAFGQTPSDEIPRGEAAPDPAPPEPESVIPFFRRARQAAAAASTPGLPRRHKLMLAAAAAVMAFGFVQAGVERLRHDATRATTAALG